MYISKTKEVEIEGNKHDITFTFTIRKVTTPMYGMSVGDFTSYSEILKDEVLVQTTIDRLELPDKISVMAVDSIDYEFWMKNTRRI